MNPVFLKASPVLERIEAAGYEAYFVGGSVRDYLLGKDISDVDIATSATPMEIKGIFPRTADVGIEHGTVVVLYAGESYEVTTFRSESEYEDFRRPSKVDFIRSLDEDLKRRDFRMNSMAMAKDGRIIDPFGGQEDIRRKRIATVGNPLERFYEDALRMMRAVRFASQLSFQIDGETYEALNSGAYLLEKIAVERKLSEFEKLLAGENSFMALNIMAETGLSQHLPGLAGKKQELISFAGKLGSGLVSEERWTLLSAALGHDYRTAEAFLRSWKMPVKKIRHICKILYWLQYRSEQSWTLESVYEAGAEAARNAEKVLAAAGDDSADEEVPARLYASLPIRSTKELDVTGNDLIQWFQQPGGPWVKELLGKVEKSIISGRLANKKEEIRGWLECNQS
ncbi:CCA tRNA nucleotidyltransferase [Bacillus infantis]|uniref:CCA tRNA nucleotidyltransferase n=1 Tax=Bacillus infantis TaxID=324767 RepID=UPI001CD31EDE|nr:CCA tRNA nucleotidyltransferase [Bacillus infantis]MCA1039829.1 CCA tRNA nucleotidyltransferase [Bacillus infantis]